MARFFKAKLHNTSVDSGTTDAAAADKLTDTAQTNFIATVSIGDYIVAAGIVYTVTAIDSNTVLSVTGGGVPDATAYTIYAGDAYTERMFSTENIIYTVRTDEYNTDLVYKHEAANNLLTFTHPSDATSEYVVDTLNNLLSDIHSGKTYPNVVSNFVPEVVLVKGVLST